MTVQEFIASGIAKSTEDLINAYNRTTPEKRSWEPEGARSSRNVLAECAIMTDGLAEVVTQGKMPDIDFDVFFGQIVALDTDEKAITALREGTDKLVAATKAIPNDKLAVDIASPWGTLHHGRLGGTRHDPQLVSRGAN